MEKYDHIQTGLEQIFGLYGVVFSGIYDSIQIRYGVGLYGGGYSAKVYSLNKKKCPLPIYMFMHATVTTIRVKLSLSARDIFSGRCAVFATTYIS